MPSCKLHCSSTTSRATRTIHTKRSPPCRSPFAFMRKCVLIFSNKLLGSLQLWVHKSHTSQNYNFAREQLIFRNTKSACIPQHSFSDFKRISTVITKLSTTMFSSVVFKVHLRRFDDACIKDPCNPFAGKNQSIGLIWCMLRNIQGYYLIHRPLRWHEAVLDQIFRYTSNCFDADLNMALHWSPPLSANDCSQMWAVHSECTRSLQSLFPHAQASCTARCPFILFEYFSLNSRAVCMRAELMLLFPQPGS